MRPSMDLPDGHMRQRPETPSAVYVGTVIAPRRSKYRQDDVVKVVGGIVHVGRRGIVVAAYGARQPLAVEIDGGLVFLVEDDVRLVRRPSDDVAFPESPSMRFSLVDVEHADGTPVGYWLPTAAEAADTLVLDDVVLTGGAPR